VNATCTTDTTTCTCSFATKPYYIEATFELNGIAETELTAPPVLAAFKVVISSFMNGTLGEPTAISDIHLNQVWLSDLTDSTLDSFRLQYKAYVHSIPPSSHCDAMGSFLRSNYTVTNGFTAQFGSKLVAAGVNDVPASALHTLHVIMNCRERSKHWTEHVADAAMAWGHLLVLFWICCACGSVYYYCCIEVIDEENAKSWAPNWVTSCWRSNDSEQEQDSSEEPGIPMETASKLYSISNPRQPGAPPAPEEPQRCIRPGQRWIAPARDRPQGSVGGAQRGEGAI